MSISRPDIEAGLEHHAPAAAMALRSALSEALNSIGVNAAKPLQLSRDLGVDKSLGWKIARIVTEDDALAAFRHLPGRPGMKIVRDRLESAGVTAPRIARIDAALDEIDQVIEYHAGDKNSFDLMLASLSPMLARERDEEFRRQAFQGNSAVWGVQARVQLSLHFLAPGDTPGKLSFGCIGGLVDLRRLRQDVSWAIARGWSYSDTGKTLSISSKREPMDPSVARRGGGGAPIIPAFSSTPLPPMSVRNEPNGVVRIELDPGPIGNVGACTCITGWIERDAADMYRSADELHGEHVVTLSTPAEVVYHDLYVHKSLTFAQIPTLHFYSLLPGGPSFPRDGINAGRLNINAEITPLGGGKNGPAASNVDFPKHLELVETGAAAMGMAIEEVVGFRLRLAYPPIPTLAVFRFDLPVKP